MRRLTRNILSLSFLISLVIECCLGCKSSSGLEAQPIGGIPEPSRVHIGEGDIARFLRFLAQRHPGEAWKQGPERIESPELQEAYPGMKFYFVSSPQPMPRGARIAPSAASGVEPERKAKPLLTLCVRFGPGDQVDELRKPEDYNLGLQSIHSDEDARTAAAAILSTLDGIYFSPSPLAKSLIQVQKTPTGWTCRLRTQTREGRVVFNQEGKCISISMSYHGPFPG